ncbi:eukaryotic translation initiation factor 3 subunit E [Serendipita sp. 396]|nr:eukaryotic translation initiation factor 3 subunit E [Serendipita sp. 396]KAG8787633.1 eukaryotic translation initiation factor 3 subunit E [Serendipita sp. 397]KAG8803027.1 eukaryotic translation initiation factor 3 subunit E [Serendipita sp. 398]KAG8826264.1 eukaryotic translation initiation factor 3 subunit E [Serendipita sp. 401]KAG8836824.1 eukaryotic translation initiation factor 3 subunit E [Serendipita sp. 400]KAG8859031.1 eukaryotic translation initiation factor 3 subunit E [Serend
MAEFDITQRLIPYLDRHLAFPVLAFLLETSLFPDADVRAAQYELARETNMVDFTIELFEQLHSDEEVPPEFAQKREAAIQTNQRLQSEAQVVLDVIEREEVAQALRQDKIQNLHFLKENYNLTIEHISALYTFGQFQYTHGDYSGAADYLYHFRILSTDSDLNISAHWGKLACDILSGQWDRALEELNSLRDIVDSRVPAVSSLPSISSDSALSQLQSRTWLLHWSLFVYFNHPQGRTLLLDTFLSPGYLNTIQTSCPWILRYLTAAAIVTRKVAATVSGRARHALKEIVRVIQMEEYQYADPITRFLKELYIEFDFDAAQQSLATAAQVVENDFFLSDLKQDFLDNARYLISEAYCRIHQRIDIDDLSNRLNLSQEEGEKWIVNLIRDMRMGADAKIDLEKNVIHINRPPTPLYQNVIERTRGLAFRTQALGAAMSRRAAGENADAPDEGKGKGKGRRAGGGGPQGGQGLVAPAIASEA